ncbi:PIN domain-containing protein [Candidatus Woesearchaeota archaeon]|nr:PIN domain-containing protein [Candidatus Woesearchaeota archaeon]
MKYCADTWFILFLFDKEQHAVRIFQETRIGKAGIAIPAVVFAEATKKLLQRGVQQKSIDLFWEGVEQSEKVKLIPVERTIAREAARVSLTYGVPLIDSLVAATAKLTGCDMLLSADSDYALLARKGYVKVQSW